MPPFDPRANSASALMSRFFSNFSKKYFFDRSKDGDLIFSAKSQILSDFFKALVQTHAEQGGFSRKPPPLVQDLGWRGILADLRLTSDMEFGDILGVLGSVLRHVESRRAC